MSEESVELTRQAYGAFTRDGPEASMDIRLQLWADRSQALEAAGLSE